MGYQSKLNIAKGRMQIKTELLKKALREIKEKQKDEDIGCYLEQMEIDNEGYIDFPEYYQKWYCSTMLFSFLAPFLENVIIEFIGEDGESWGYEINEGILYHIRITKKYIRINKK